MSSSSSTSSSDRSSLARFLLRAALFAVPALLYMAAIVVADPFRLFAGIANVFPAELKAKTARPINPCLWKLIAFDQQPAAHILLGDSRMENIPEEAVSRHTRRHYTNLAYGGATLNEIVDTFWFAANRIQLSSVTIGINLNVYNDYSIYRRTEAVESFMANRLLYFTNRNVTRAAYYTYASYLTGKDPDIDRVTAGRDEFWQGIIDEQNLEYSRWVDPVKYRAQLRKIAEWCRTHNVALTFVVLPTHQDIHAVVHKRNLDTALASMKKEFASWGRLVDFDGDIALSQDRSLYSDPVHVNRQTSAALVPRIFPSGL